jgi:hypothetical protein
MRHIVICGLTARQYFSTLSHKRHGFRKKVTEDKMCILMLSTGFVRSISHSKKKLARYDRSCILVYVKYPIFLSDFNENWIFSTDFRKKLWKFVHWKPSFSVWTEERTDGEIDMTKLIIAFRNFMSAPKRQACGYKTHSEVVCLMADWCNCTDSSLKGLWRGTGHFNIHVSNPNINCDNLHTKCQPALWYEWLML